MFCGNCGKDIKFTDHYCPYCRSENEFFINPDDFVADFSSDDHHPKIENNTNHITYTTPITKEEKNTKKSNSSDEIKKFFLTFAVIIFFVGILIASFFWK